MKKIFAMILPAALLIAGCAKEMNNSRNSTGDTVTFTVTTENAVSTKAVADEDGAGANVNHWIMEVRDCDDNVYSRKEVDTDAGTLKQNFTVKLIKGQTYTVLFWADTKGTYDVADLTDVKLLSAESAGYIANKDSRDAFSAVVSNFECTGASSQNVTLKRPFGQLNIIFTDLEALRKDMISQEEYLKYRPCSLKVTAKVPTSFNVQTQTAGDPATTALNLTAEGDYMGNYATHRAEETIFMDYFFATAGSKDVVDLGFSFVSNNVKIEHSFNSVPFQRNYRTNIKGEHMTAGATWNVTVDPTWEKPEIDVKYASTLAQAQEIVGTASDDAIVVEVKQEAVTNATEDDVVTVGGKKYLQFILKTTSPLYVGFELPEITNTDYERLGADTWLVTYEPTYPTTNVTVDAPESTKVKIEAPTSHVEVTGTTYAEITASTGDNTLVVPSGISVSNLIVNKGGLEIHGTVAAASVVITGSDKVYVRACENLIKDVYDNLEPYIDVDNGYVGEKVAENNYRIYIKKEKVAKIGDVEYYTLGSAVAAATAGQIIELINDVPMPYSNVYLRFKDTVTLDLKDYTITNGVIDADGDYDYEDGHAYVFEGKGITIKNGKILGVANGVEGYCYGLYIGNEEDGNIATSDVIVQDVVFPKGGINIYNSTGVTVKDCYVTVQPTSYYAVYVCGDGAGASVAINGGTYRAGTNGYVVCTQETNYEGSAASMTISAGTFTGGYSVEEGGSLSMTGGTYSVDPTTYVAQGYEAEKVDDVWIVSPLKVAKIGSTKYETLAAAFSAVKDGETIELLHNCSLATSTTIDKNITLDLKSLTLTSTVSADYLFKVASGKSFTLNDGSVADASEGAATGLIQPTAATVTVSKVNFGTFNTAGTSNILFPMTGSTSLTLTDVTVTTNNNVVKTSGESNALVVTNGTYTDTKRNDATHTFDLLEYDTSSALFDGVTITSPDAAERQSCIETDATKGTSNIVLKNCTIKAEYGNTVYAAADMTIINCDIETADNANNAYHAVSVETEHTLNIYGGTYKGSTKANSAALKIWTSGGTIKVYDKYNEETLPVVMEGNYLFYIDSNNKGEAAHTAEVYFEGDNIQTKGQWAQQHVAKAYVKGGYHDCTVWYGSNANTFILSGGTYTMDPRTSNCFKIADGYMAVQNEGTPETWSIVKQPGVGLGSMSKDNQDW